MTRRPRHGIPISRRRPGVAVPHGAADEMEAPLQTYVRRECKALDLLHYHTYRSQRSERGFPDSVIVGPRGVMFRELKSDTGRPDPDQVLWLNGLRTAGADAGIWTPQDRRTGRILNELTWLARDRPAAIGDLRADLAKTLYLFARADDEPAAALHWDAGSRHVHHDQWHLNAETTLRMLLAVLPRLPQEVNAWLREHRLSRPDPARIFAVLGEDLARAIGGRS